MLAIWSKMTLYPLKRLILGAQIELSADRAEQLVRNLAAVLGCCAGSLWPEMAWMSPPGQGLFRSPANCPRWAGWRRLGR